ncbi:MAG: MFS transporter [Acetilactobacillus jinshanensis]
MNSKSSSKELTEIFTIAFVSFIGILMTTAVNVNFPMLVKYFQLLLSNVQWISTGAMITSAVTMVCSAYLDKRFNDKTVFLIATLALLLSLLICTFANNFGLFLVGRLFNGISIGTCTPLMFNVIPKLVPSNKIGFYMALGATVLAVGPSLGPTYGGFVNYYLSWRMIFLLVIPVIYFLVQFTNISLSSLLIPNFTQVAIGVTSLCRLVVPCLINLVLDGRSSVTF